MVDIKKVVKRVFEEIKKAEGAANENGTPVEPTRPINKIELGTLQSLIAFNAETKALTVDTVQLAVAEYLAIDDIQKMPANDYDDAMRFLIDFKGFN
jgi:hypothetical protein